MFVDDVPLYVPYDGYVDFGRFTTFDLAEIRVAKADASLLYGPNTPGGAINLVTRKPVKPFEGDALLGLGAGQARKAAVNLGGNQGSWYYRIGASYLKADSFSLPKGFRDAKKVPTDTDNYRENADRIDKRVRFSARNHLQGQVARVHKGAVNTEVVIGLPGGRAGGRARPSSPTRAPTRRAWPPVHRPLHCSNASSVIVGVPA